MANQFKGTPVTTHDAEHVNTDIMFVNGSATTAGLPIDDSTPIGIDLINFNGTLLSATNPLPVTDASLAGTEKVKATKLTSVTQGGAAASTASSDAIPASTIGKLRRVTLAGSVGAEAQIKNGAGTVVGYLFLGHNGGTAHEEFRGDAATAAATEDFDVDVFNLDDDDDIDITVTIHHDEFAA